MLEGEQLEVLAYYRLSQDLSLYPEVNRAHGLQLEQLGRVVVAEGRHSLLLAQPNLPPLLRD